MRRIKTAIALWTGLVLTLAWAGSPAGAGVDYGDVTVPPDGKAEKVAKQDGVPFRWLSTYEGVPIYKDSMCKYKLSTLKFRQELFELWRNDEVVLLADAKDAGRTITKVVGYTYQKDVIGSRKNTYRGLRATNGILRKALVVHRWDKGGSAITAEADLRNRPDAKAKSIGQVRLFDVLYIYAMSPIPDDPKDGFCLVATNPNCEVADAKLHSERFVGWLENRRVFFWNNRQAVEYNKDIEAVKWRRQNKQPIRFYADKDEIRDGQEAVEEDLELGDPWVYHLPRFPIVSTKPTLIKGVEYFHLGVIGDSYEASGGDRIATAALESEIREGIETMTKSAANMDVLFVIDATGSMGRYYQSIGKSVATIRRDLQGSRETPIRYAVMYYRDYTEEKNKNSWSKHFEDFVTEDKFGSKFPHQKSSGGAENPPPFFALDTAVKKASWKEGSMRVVILIGDMGNEEPDSRDFSVKGVIDTLRTSRCEFFAIQAAPDKIADPRVQRFNDQAKKMAIGVGMPDKQSQILSADGVDVADAVYRSVNASNERANRLREILQKLRDGEAIDESIVQVLKTADIDAKAESTQGTEGKYKFASGGHGSKLKQMLVDRFVDNGIDVELFARKRIQHFGLAYSPVKIANSPHDSFRVRVLMSREEFQGLTSVLATVKRRGVTPANVAEVWRKMVNQLTGELDEELTFDENTPLSEYMDKVLGVPVRSELLKKSVIEIKRLDPGKLIKQRLQLEELWEKMNNYDDNMSPDGKSSELHWFTRHGGQYGWIPLDLMP